MRRSGRRVEEPRLRGWQAGLEIDLGAEGTRLRRYEAAADRLFRSAWRKLERLRKERGEPLMPGTECGLAPEPAAPCEPPAAPPPATAPPAAAPACPEVAFPELSLRGDPAASVLDLWVGGSPRPGITPAILPSTRRTRRRAGTRGEDEPVCSGTSRRGARAGGKDRCRPAAVIVAGLGEAGRRGRSAQRQNRGQGPESGTLRLSDGSYAQQFSLASDLVAGKWACPPSARASGSRGVW